MAQRFQIGWMRELEPIVLSRSMLTILRVDTVPRISPCSYDPDSYCDRITL